MKLLITLLTAIFTLTVVGQERSSVGFRAGGVTGFTYQYLDKDLLGFEIIAGFQQHGIRMAGLLEKHKKIKEKYKTDMYLVTGAGAHSGYVGYDEYDTWINDGVTWYRSHKTYSPVIGADFLIGLEFIFRSVPL
ncbi:MAG: hypothetical protein JW731_14690 [Bacteroidales bacterium]|nr:hypothetical protein [Bacteroidales bacterium]